MKYFIVKKLDNRDSPLVLQIIQKIARVAQAVKWEEVQDPANAELVIAIGGDGTLLQAMRISDEFDIAALGVNIGKLGFLAEIQPEMIEEAIIDIVNGKWFLDDRVLLRERDCKCIAVNEFYIAPTLSKDTLKYEFFIDGKSSGFHHANGLVIATPTGSSAYSLSVGGAIIQPNAPVFQITPVAPMSLNSRSVIVGNDSKISVRIRLRQGTKYSLVSDGRLVREFDSLDGGGGDDYSPEFHNSYETLHFEKHQNIAKLMHLDRWNFFEVLKEKLHWNTEI